MKKRLKVFDFDVPEFVPGTDDVTGYRSQHDDASFVCVIVNSATLQRTRTSLEKQYIWDITGYGRLIARDDKKSFISQVEALKVQLLAHAKELKRLIEQQSTEIIDSAVDLILERASRSGSSLGLDPEQLRDSLRKGLNRGKEEEPKISLVFKDVTFEQTKNDDFRDKVKNSLPLHKRRQLGDWVEHFDAVRETGDRASPVK